MLGTFCNSGRVPPAFLPQAGSGCRWLESSLETWKEKMKSMRFPITALAFTFSLAVCAQAQTVTNFANFDGQNGHDPVGSMRPPSRLRERQANVDSKSTMALAETRSL